MRERSRVVKYLSLLAAAWIGPILLASWMAVPPTSVDAACVAVSESGTSRPDPNMSSWPEEIAGTATGSVVSQTTTRSEPGGDVGCAVDNEHSEGVSGEESAEAAARIRGPDEP